MSELQEYVVEANGMEHTMLLDEADAERLSAKPVKGAKASTPANKAADAANKSGGR